MLTAPEIRRLKRKKKIIMLTAYDYIMAKYLEKAGVDIILVGDSLGMVFKGEENTLNVSVDEIIYHTKAVKKGAKNTFLVADMPFLSYQVSKEEAVKNAGRIIKESGANAVKIEGGEEVIDKIKAIINIGIPVMGHIGLQPQSVHKYGGYPVQGVTSEEKEKLINSALNLEKAGAFAIVVEKVKANVTKEITKKVNIPIIGIGSGPFCDGQVLVTYDLLGFFPDFKPKFVKQYDEIGKRIENSILKFIKDVNLNKFPSKKNYF